MSRHVFFSFDFDDVWAANIVRNSNVIRKEDAKLPFRDYSLYEKVKNTPATIQRAIDDGLVGTSVTVVANGGATYLSRWVRYEIAKSLQRGNALMVVDIDGVGLSPQPTKGPHPLDFMAARPWQDGRGFDVLEYNGSAWVSFDKIPKVSMSECGYPASFCSGAAWKLKDRFTFRKHWNDLGVQLYFPTALGIEAGLVGK